MVKDNVRRTENLQMNALCIRFHNKQAECD